METSEILDTNIVMDRKEGVVTVFSLIEYPPSNSANFDTIFPETIDYVKAIDIALLLRKKGKMMGAIDIIIAAMCLNRSLTLTTKDKDFKAVKDSFPEFKLNLINVN